MKPRFLVGLLVGAVGLILTACVSYMVGICGPIVSLVAGAAAAFLAISRERPTTQDMGARIGATAAAVAASVALLGQILGGILANRALRSEGIELPFGTVPGPGAGMDELLIFYGFGAATSFCIGLIGVALAAGVGYLVGKLATRTAAPPPPVQPY